jgi:hypothetical protein
LTDSNISNTLKIRILFNNIFNLKLLLSTNPANLNIQYVNIGKIFRSDMIIFIIDNQHLLFIDLKQDIDPNNFLATYSANSNIILQFSSFFENLLNLSELREQSPKI